MEPFKQKISNSTFIHVLWYALHVKIFDTIEMFDFFLLLSLVALQNGIFNPDMTWIWYGIITLMTNLCGFDFSALPFIMNIVINPLKHLLKRLITMLQTLRCLWLLVLTEVMSDGTQIFQCYSGLIAEDWFVHLLEE